MPFTPFHFGPAAFSHAMAPRHVSFLAFCTANVLIEIEPLYYLLNREFPLHRFFHTCLGSTLILLATGCIFIVLLSLARRLDLRDFGNWRSLRTSSVWLGAALGTYSHVFLDSIMHADVFPFAPFSQANFLYELVPAGLLHLLCILAALAGVFILQLRRSHA